MTSLRMAWERLSLSGIGSRLRHRWRYSFVLMDLVVAAETVEIDVKSARAVARRRAMP